jgi:hypothetical protein
MPRYTPAEIRGEVLQTVKEDVQRRFVIGPTVEREFWEAERAQMALDRGPCEYESVAFLPLLTQIKGLRRGNTWRR